MPVYDDRFFNPPGPLARVTLRTSSDGNAVRDVPMLIDSGADVTLVPQQSIDLLGATVDSDAAYEIMGFDGRKSFAHVASLDLIFLRRVLRGRFLIGNQECGVLGRNILNHVALLLDGPRLVWDEEKFTNK
jgi:hypothetical protein